MFLLTPKQVIAYAAMGGMLYLLNKIARSLQERATRDSNVTAFWRWKKWGWGVYLAGLAPIVAILLNRNDYIFSAIELGGIPAMAYGLAVAFKRRDPPKWLRYPAMLAAPAGLAWSWWMLGGIHNLNQMLEICGGVAFLRATYLLSEERIAGYPWNMVMGIATATLWLRESKPWWLIAMQVASVALAVDAYLIKRKVAREVAT